MTGLDSPERTAPDAASGAVPVPALRARDFWRAVAGELLATLTPWPR
ncbi:hypothetical protein KC207_10995 [Phycicoccus sp. BSK3Z-2]|uniref:Uncharacterized protein n=1 Tax=Phycicoccus avicenniae TaxID=2828860 RepID=A0A941D973_9MICO|nr:hypothetical protein [Phycicoccus avicenniae]MBR7743816.1 hypothetical protein [Phycicoccus avicenniae]